MGYDAYILICGTDSTNNQYELEYGTSGGSYSAVSNHYLYIKSEQSPNYNYNGPKQMGNSQYKISYGEIEEDYKLYKLSFKDVKESVMHILATEDDNFQILCKLENYVEQMLSNKHNDCYYEELKSIYYLCKGFIDEGYKNIKVIYGITY